MKKSFKILTPIATAMVLATSVAPIACLSSCANSGSVSKEAHLLYETALEQFKLICNFPHASGFKEGNLEQLKQHITSTIDHEYGAGHVQSDRNGNIWWDLPASEGYENTPKVILQGHYDMVWAVKDGTGHNPKIPEKINWEISNDANGRPTIHSKNFETSLGGDDGMAVATAIAMSLLKKNKDSGIKTGPIRVILTADEEPGMIGAAEVAKEVVDSNFLVNLDDESEGEVVIGCAGGYSHKYLVKNFGAENWEDYDSSNDDYYHLRVAGLHGGHSGGDINDGYANAIKIAAKILKNATSTENPIKLVSINTGSAVTNAIPQTCDMYFTIPNNPTAKSALDSSLASVLKENREKYPKESTLQVFTEKQSGEPEQGKVLGGVASYLCLRLADKLWYGPLTWTDIEHKIIESSANVCPMYLGYSRKDEKTQTVLPQFEISIYARAALNDLKEVLAGYESAQYVEFAYLLRDEAHVDIENDNVLDEKISDFPPFEPNMQNALLPIIEKANNSVGIKTRQSIIHGGIECSIWADKHPGINQISIGADLAGEHSPNETFYLDSFERMEAIVLNILEQIHQLKK